MDCVDIIRQGIGRDLSEEEILGLFKQAKILRRRVRAGRNAADMERRVREASLEWARQEELAAIAQKRAIELQAEKRLNNVAYVLNTFRGMEAEGLSALQVGSKYAREGARLSVDAIRSGLEGQYLGGFLTDLEALGKAHVALFRKGELDRDVARAMWTIDNPAAEPYTGPGEAMDIARVIHKWQEKTRLDQNQAGAWIGKEPGYIVRQSHDAAKLRKLGFDKWKESISDKLDWTRTADGRFDPGVNPKEAEAFLVAVYRDIVTGIHLRTGDEPVSLVQSRTIGSAAARASRERVLRFKSGDAWFDYNEQFGFGNLRDALLRGMTKAAQNTALMRVFGPSPQANLDDMIQDVMRALTLRGDHQGVERVRNMQKRLHNQMEEIDGTLNIEGNPTIAAIGRNIRTMESLAKLGGALISSMTDAPNFAEEFSYQGRGFFSALVEGISLMLKGRGSLTQRRILSQCGVFFDSMSGDLAARFSGEELPGKLTALQNLFFKMNGLS